MWVSFLKALGRHASRNELYNAQVMGPYGVLCLKCVLGPDGASNVFQYCSSFGYRMQQHMQIFRQEAQQVKDGCSP